MRKPVVVVAGASRGIGLAVAQSLVEEHDANVLALARSRTAELCELIDAHPASLLAVSCDVTDESALTEAFRRAKDAFGALDGLVLNAGTFEPPTRIGDPVVRVDAWKEHFDVNFFSLVSTLKLALPALRDSPGPGRVIFVSSGAATGATAGWGPYNASKAAVNSLARTLAAEEPGIVSVAIAPGKVDTAMQATIRTTGGGHMDARDLAVFLDAHRDGTLVRAADVGHVIAGLSLRAPSGLSGRQMFDVHHHVLLDAELKQRSNALVGWSTPPEHLPWRPAQALSAMDAMGVHAAVLSPPPLTTPSRSQARALNVFLSQVRAAHPTRFAFLAGLPTPSDGDVQGALGEIAFAMDHLHADGIALVSSYGTGDAAKYIADDLFDPIWDELDRRHAVVFLHGAQTPSSTPYPHPFLGLPISEVPNETYKAAAHLVVTGKKRRFHNVKVILAHLGGSTPFLAPRVAALSHHMGCPLSPDEILRDFTSFYYETALSSHPSTLAVIDTFVPSDHILFGSDYPAVSTVTSSWYTKHLLDHYASQPHRLDAILRDNALALFPRLRA